MAIVEDEVRNDSEEENEIEVVVEEDDADRDSDDSEVRVFVIFTVPSHLIYSTVILLKTRGNAQLEP